MYLSVYEWKWFKFGPGVLSRRIGFAILAWVVVSASCMIVTGSQSHLSVDVFGTLVVAGGFAAWLGLLVRLVAPGIFVAADRVKIRNFWWTYVLLSRDVAGFERGPLATLLWHPAGAEAIWVVRRDGRRIRSQIRSRVRGFDPWRRSAPGPKLTATELDAVVSRLNKWLADSND